MKNLDEWTPSDINKQAEDEGKAYAQGIKTNQIRNFFAHVNQMRTRFKQAEVQGDKKNDEVMQTLERQLILLKPKLAYAAGRQTVVKPMYIYLAQVIDATTGSVNKEKAFQNFFDLVEGIVAYHKFYDGRDN
jgi:CRISPR-associated protein Csm2